MKHILLFSSVLALAACTGQNKTTNHATSMADSPDSIGNTAIGGEWVIEHVVVSDTVDVRPADIDPEALLMANFDSDGSFSFATGCNNVSGTYVQKGDSIILDNFISTTMACENMEVEDMVKQVLPMVNTVDWSNDSTLRLNTGSSAYIVLVKPLDK